MTPQAGTADFQPSAKPILADLFLTALARDPAHVYAIFPDQTATLGEVHAQAEAMAKGMVALGLEQGDHVGILMPNCLDFIVAHTAVQLAGGISILLNARYRSHELDYAVGFSDCRMLITTNRFDDAINYGEILETTFPALSGASGGARLDLANAPKLERIVSMGPSPAAHAMSEDDLGQAGADVDEPALTGQRAGLADTDTALMIFTSGTTSQPKACEITHAGVQRSWDIFNDTVGFRPGEKVWTAMPFFHSGGIGLLTGMLTAGGSLASAPLFEPDTVIDMVEGHRIEHVYPGFHILAAPLMDSPRYSAEAWSFVRSMPCIGPRGTLERLQNALPPGAPILSIFGMSEGAGLVTLSGYDDPLDVRMERSGTPLAGIDVRIGDPETGEFLGPFQTGEILFRGGGALRRYYKNPEATAATIRPDGFVRTGDLGNLDEAGRLKFEGRIKDMLKVGGENVAAAEVESYLSTHPAVADVQVVGRPDDRLGEAPVAFVELRAGQSVEPETLIEHCRGKIARYKIPSEIRFVTEWPMSATKIQKYKLKELL